ncbi:nucleoside deaminase [Anaerococcus sp. mt242]|uniref:nucleoside deaminase n=1 Tax=Anaerococcus sp. mt242 TaxID=2661917 RepID=UPI0019323717|nr:nucleoside deaminase [Anaerococcus sp. mt242]MBM0046756.1 nucleoside deaminase [Anaerococcus sp. mt242]
MTEILKKDFTSDDYFFMNEALYEARLARFIEEVPVGCVIVYDGKIIGRGHNFTFKGKSGLLHAEMIAIKEANEFFDDFRLENTTMYVTMEPCSMCAGAIINSRIARLVIGIPDYKRGACGSNNNITGDRSQLHFLDAEFGLRDDECLFELQSFFKMLRARNKEKKLLKKYQDNL